MYFGLRLCKEKEESEVGVGKIREAIYGIHHMDETASRDQWIQRLHPLAKLLVTFAYIFITVSFDRYNLPGLAGMGIYLLALFILGKIPFFQAVRQLKVILAVSAAVGIANPFLDRSTVGSIGGFVVTGGMISMITLMLKGIYSVLASYLLIASTSIEEICYALQCLKIPRTFITVILLIYRYMIVLLKEAERITGIKPMLTISEAEPIGPGSLLDLLILLPCTGNTIAKLANGITDTPALMAAKAHL